MTEGSPEGESIRAAAALSFAAKVSSAAATLLSGMVMARLLTPAQTGIFVLGLGLSMFLETIREFGVANYLVQERELTREKVRAAFSVTVLLACGSASVLLMASGPMARFYDAPELATVLLILACGFFVAPLGSPALGLLRRELRFRTLYGILTTASLVRAIVSITLASIGFGPASIAWGAVMGALLTSLWACLCKPSCGLMVPTFRGVGPVLAFGGKLTVAGLIARCSESATQMMVGRVLGLGALGLFSRAHNLVVDARGMIFGSLTNVAFPAIALRIRDGREIGESYLRACSLLTGIVWPLSGFLFLMAFPTFRVLFGAQWDAGVPLFRILIVTNLVYEALPFVIPVLLATDRVGYLAKGEAWIQGSRMLLVWLAVSHGLKAVCVAEILVSMIFLVVFGREMRLAMNLSPRAFVRAQSRSALVTVCSLGGPALSVLAFGLTPAHPLPPLIVAATVSGVGWLAGVFLVRHELQHEISRAMSWMRSMGQSRMAWFHPAYLRPTTASVPSISDVEQAARPTER
jgi:O-antigen/teichoic acid export membrane protein